MLNSYEKMKELVANKLASVSTNGNLDTFKYSRKVMFDNLWDKYPELYECRGHTYDNTTGEVVIAAPRKSFNYMENGCGANLKDSEKVYVHKKYNGFLACISIHNGEVIVSTTGSTKSDFVKMAREVLDENYTHSPNERYTDFYEIIHDNDPHIVDEGSQKAVWLGSRTNEGCCFSWNGAMEMTFGEAKELANNDRGEGFMVYSINDLSNAIKLKSPYYVGKKKLMRLSKKNTDMMYSDPVKFAQNLPKMWQDVPEQIVSIYSREFWNECMTEGIRRELLEQMKGT